MDDERSSSVLGVWAETLADTSKSAKAYRQILFAIFFQVILYKFMEFEDATTISKVHKHVRHFLQDPSAACIDSPPVQCALRSLSLGATDAHGRNKPRLKIFTVFTLACAKHAAKERASARAASSTLEKTSVRG